METPECSECVAKDKEIAELHDHIAFLREQIALLKKVAFDLENIFLANSKPD